MADQTGITCLKRASVTPASFSSTASVRLDSLRSRIVLSFRSIAMADDSSSAHTAEEAWQNQAVGLESVSGARVVKESHRPNRGVGSPPPHQAVVQCGFLPRQSTDSGQTPVLPSFRERNKDQLSPSGFIFSIAASTFWQSVIASGNALCAATFTFDEFFFNQDLPQSIYELQLIPEYK
jgi:hypothetical protein